jgi:hypothetical protein
MLMPVTVGLAILATFSLVIGMANNALGPIYLAILCSAATLVVLGLWSKLVPAQPAERSTANHTDPPSANWP